jgi:hypothetical protein
MGGLAALEQQRSSRFIDGRRKGKHILRTDRLFARKKPGPGSKCLTQTFVGWRFQLGQGVEYLTMKAVRLTLS